MSSAYFCNACRHACDRPLEETETYCPHCSAPTLIDLEPLLKRAHALEEATSGWRGYGWKDGQYVDDLAEFFEEVKNKS